MKKKMIGWMIIFIMIFSSTLTPTFAITGSQWMEVRDKVLREVEMEIIEYHEGTDLAVSDSFKGNLENTLTALGDDADYPWIMIQDALANFLNQSLEETDPDIVVQLVSYAQDYNAARSNKPTSEVFVDEDSDGDGLDDGSEENQTKAQDYNSSRSNRPRTEIHIDEIDDDSDGDGLDDGSQEDQLKAQDYNSSRSNKPSTAVFVDEDDPDSDGDGLIELAERIEIRIPIDSKSITMLENIEVKKLDMGPENGNADVILAIIFANSVQEKLRFSGMLSQCELNDKGLAFYFQDQDNASQQYLKDEFFIPLGIGGDLDCDDDGLDDVRPGESTDDNSDDEVDKRLVLRIGNENVTAGSMQKVLKVPPFIQSSRTMVPFRFIGEELGAEIEWDAEESKVEYRLDDNILELWIGNNTARINGEDVMLDEDPTIRPFIINSRTVVPVRFISEALGFEVTWKSETQEITIEKGNPLYEGQTQEGESPLFDE